MSRGRQLGEKGSSLLEVLIALAILLFLMIGVLSMFSMAYLANLGSAARTDMTYRAQQVADVIRYLNYIHMAQPASVPASSLTGIPFPLTAGTSSTLTALSGSNLQYAYWGAPTNTVPDAANVLNPEDLPYVITVDVEGPNAVGLMTVTVHVIPNTSAASRRYIGTGIRWKEVDYVTQLPQ